MTRECLYVSHFCQKKTRAKNESIHADRRKALWGRWKAKKSGRNSRFGVHRIVKDGQK